MFSFALCLVLCMSQSSASKVLDGLWTTLPNERDEKSAKHDALRVTSGEVACKHGGWRDLIELPCSFSQARISLNGASVMLSTGAKGHFQAKTTNCSWTDKAPGTYWTGAGEYQPPYSPACSLIRFESGEVWLRLREVSQVHVVSMSHLDVGYTGSISFTLNSYFSNFFPTAIRVQQELEAQGRPEKLHYITHPWIVYLYLHCEELTEMTQDLDVPVECPNATALATFKHAVQAGTITWHAGPMNMQVDWMTAEVFKFGISMSHTLDALFGLAPKTVMSQRDVPGMTRGVVPLLREMNVTGISVGMNGGVCPPWVPNLFRWRMPGGDDSQEVVAAWHPGGYPDIYGCPGSNMLNCTETLPGTLGRRECMLSGDQAFCFAFRTDNTGPPRSWQEVVHGFTVAKTQFPLAEVIPGSLDDFFAIARSDPSLPIVTNEIGDVWIPGVQSDVWKASVTRRMQKSWDHFVKNGGDTSGLEKAGAYLLKLTEHTWGLSDLEGKSKNWTNAELQAQLSKGDFKRNLDDWDLQRNFTRFALEALPAGHPLHRPWKQAIDGQVVSEPSLSGFRETDARSFSCPMGRLSITESGAAVFDGLKFGELSYETLGEDVYNGSKYVCDAVFGGKTNSSHYVGGQTMRTVATLKALYISTAASGCDFWANVEITGDGAPAKAWTRFVGTVSHGVPSVKVRFLALGKVPTRFNEAAWLSFASTNSESSENGIWQVTKLGQPVGFDEVVRGGSSTIHGADSVSYSTLRAGMSSGKARPFTIESFDAPILSPIGQRGPSVLLNYQEERAKQVQGVAFNLWNNAWSTNYMFFYPFHAADADFGFEFQIAWGEKDDGATLFV